MEHNRNEVFLAADAKYRREDYLRILKSATDMLDTITILMDNERSYQNKMVKAVGLNALRNAKAHLTVAINSLQP